MLKRYHSIVGGLFRAVDIAVIAFVWLASYWLRFNFPLVEVTKGFPAFSGYAALTPLVMFLWWIVFSSLRVYRPRRILRRTDEAFLILKAHFVAMLFFIAITYLFSEYRYSRAVMVYFGVLGAVLLVVFRLLLRNLLRAARMRGFNLRFVLLAGEGALAELMCEKLAKYPELGLRVIGAVTTTGQSAGLRGGIPVLGDLAMIPDLLRKHSVDQLLIVLPRDQSSQVDTVLNQIKDESVEVRLVPDIHDYVTLGCEVEEFDGFPVVNLNDSPLDGWGSVIKRFMDAVCSFVALAVLSPLFLLIALAVKMTSRGPIFYGQERMGLDGRIFKMWKFRSMRVDAEKGTGAVWAQKADDRRTPIGALLRATSLDELPQFWNVLCGDMSLVGPRPERPVFVDKFKTEIPHYMLRHKVKAGITGWAQVNGWRGNTSLDRRIEFDLYYIRNWSFLLDLKILCLTLWKGFVNKNAY